MAVFNEDTRVKIPATIQFMRLIKMTKKMI